VTGRWRSSILLPKKRRGLAMIDEPPSKPPKDGRVAIRRFTLALAPLLWCVGFFICHVRGCDETDTLLKTVTYTVSGLGGWLAYLLVWRPTDVRCFRWVYVTTFTNHLYLQSTVPPWPFWRMLGYNLIVSTLILLLCGLMMSRVERHLGIKPTPRSSVHPLSDDQIA
jgi:hypothetical protein